MPTATNGSCTKHLNDLLSALKPANAAPPALLAGPQVSGGAFGGGAFPGSGAFAPPATSPAPVVVSPNPGPFPPPPEHKLPHEFFDPLRDGALLRRRGNALVHRQNHLGARLQATQIVAVSQLNDTMLGIKALVEKALDRDPGPSPDDGVREALVLRVGAAAEVIFDREAAPLDAVPGILRKRRGEFQDTARALEDAGYPEAAREFSFATLLPRDAKESHAHMRERGAALQRATQILALGP